MLTRNTARDVARDAAQDVIQHISPSKPRQTQLHGKFRLSTGLNGHSSTLTLSCPRALCGLPTYLPPTATYAFEYVSSSTSLSLASSTPSIKASDPPIPAAAN